MKNIKSIHYPNTAIGTEQGHYIIGETCDEIKQISKNGEMASVNWFQVIRNNQVIAEIKESVCDIYGLDEIEKTNF